LTIPNNNTIREKPAIFAWSGPGISTTIVDEVEKQISGKDLSGRIIVSANEDKAGGHYVYAVYNLNSDQGMRSFSVSLNGSKPKLDSIGSSAPISHGESWSNEPWVAKVDGDKITWSTRTFDEDKNANAIRWGATRTFWFDSDQPPARKVTFGRFVPGMAADTKTVDLQTPP
jgi:hypothetical protein